MSLIYLRNISLIYLQNGGRIIRPKDNSWANSPVTLKNISIYQSLLRAASLSALVIMVPFSQTLVSVSFLILLDLASV